MPTTSNFGWTTPADTDLVKDGALAIRTLGNGIDTSMMDLKGGTTGQVLSKASNTDMDFTWVAQDDSNAIQNAIVDAKGDLIAATGNDVPARLAVGNNGETLVADSSATTGLRWQGNFAAGKNKIINGDFGIWQRGTSFTSSFGYTADRWVSNNDGTGACTVSQQSFTAGTAPVAGYEGQYFIRQQVTTAGTATYFQIQQAIEDVRTFAGQTCTVSFWAKADTSRNGTLFLQQNFGSGGSSTVTVINQTFALTTSWQRFTFTATMPSISGKTIGTNNYIHVLIRSGATSVGTQLDVWGVQVEAGSVATAFQTATGTLAGELAACQRYYWRTSNVESAARLPGIGGFTSTTNGFATVQFPVAMRTNPASVDYASLTFYDYNTGITVTNLALTANGGSNLAALVTITVASGGTQYRPAHLATSATTGYIGMSAEL